MGFEFVRVDALGDEGLIENYSPCLGESANKILFLCRKGCAMTIEKDEKKVQASEIIKNI